MQQISVFVKNLTSGGAEKQSVLLAKALAGDYNVHYIIFNGKKVHTKYMDMLKEDKRIHVMALKGGHIKRFYAFTNYVRNNKIVAIFSYLTAANFYACLAGKQVGAKVFTGLRNAKLPIMKRLADCILTNNFAEKAISNSFSGKENFTRNGFDSSKIVVIPNCFENIKPYYHKSNSADIRIITVGRFVPQKDYETAIRSIVELRKRCPNIIFDIVGYGVLEHKIRQWIKRYGINDITSVHLNPPNIPELLDKADIYISTSLFEGTSNSIMEAMNANLPIIATNVGDNKQLIEEGRNGMLCPPKDYLAISKKLEKLVNNFELRISMGKSSKTLLLENYSMTIFRNKYLKLLHDEKI